MIKRPVFLTLAAGLLAWSLGAMEARAGSSTLANLIATNGSFTVDTHPSPGVGIVQLTFSNFSYHSIVNSPSAKDITISWPQNVPNAEFGGLAIDSSKFAVSTGGFQSETIDFKVTATPGSPPPTPPAATNGFFLTGNPTGGVSLLAKSVSGSGGGVISSGVISNLTSSTTMGNYAPHAVVNVADTYTLVGSGGSASLTHAVQTFHAVPEPASMALLGIGMAGFFAFRRYFKRPAVA